jgi:hypothetical protein
LVWVLTGWTKYSLRENTVLLQKRNLVVAKPSMQGVEFARCSLKNPQVAKKQRQFWFQASGRGGFKGGIGGVERARQRSNEGEQDEGHGRPRGGRI